MNTKKFFPWLITAVAVSIIFILNFKIGDKKVEVSFIEKKIADIQEKLQPYSELDKIFGKASETFYADKPVLFLKSGGDVGFIAIYLNKKSNVKIYATPSSDDIKVELGEWIIHNWKDYIVTPPNKPGYYTIHFASNQDAENFEVLVVVK